MRLRDDLLCTGVRQVVPLSVSAAARAPLTTARPVQLQHVGSRKKPVRFSLDLDLGLHRCLKCFALDSNADASVVIRALLAEMQDDEDLADKVRARVSS